MNTETQKPYIETLLDFLDSWPDQTIGRKEIEEHLNSIHGELGTKRISGGILNFVRIDLIVKIGSNQYKINHGLLRSFKEGFEKDELKIWYDPNGQKKKPSGLIPIRAKTEQIDTPSAEPEQSDESIQDSNVSKRQKDSKQIPLRAIVTAISGPWSNELLYKTAQELGFDSIDLKACGNLRVHKRDCFDIHGTIDGKLFYSPNELFFRKYINEKQYYKEILPDHKESIDRAFEGTKAELSPDFDDMEFKVPLAVQKGIRPTMAICAALCAYKKGMSGQDIVNILAKHDVKVAYSAWGAFFKRHSQLLTIVEKRGRAFIVKANDLFYKRHFINMETLISILPARQEQIKKNFALHGCYNDDPPAAAQEQTPQEQTPQDDIDLSAEPAQDDMEQEQEQEGYTMVDAANVGASILNYISVLKKEIHNLRANDPTRANDLRVKLENANQEIINLKNEKQNLLSQIDKLKTIAEQNNQKIIDLSHRVSVLNNKVEDAKKVIPSTFKLGEVARMTTLIKGKI